MKKLKLLALVIFILLLAVTLVSCGSTPAEEVPTVELSNEAKACIGCHSDETVGIVLDWDGSAHEKEGVSCIDCHEVNPDSPMVLQDVEGHEGLPVTLSMLVPPSVCGDCHEDALAQFNESGHYKAHHQPISSDSMTALFEVQVGQNHPGFSTTTSETGCIQCHGTEIDVDETGHPTAETYPSAGIGNVYPNGDIGNCTACHSRHTFDIAEARKVNSCSGCHVDPNTVYESALHGQLFATEGQEWVWDSPSGEWEPGDYRAPTCATCHMSGIAALQPTHNVTQRLYWTLWATSSEVRNSESIMDGHYGDGVAGREEMKQVCASCHASTHTEAHFASGDQAVMLYNVAYWQPIEAMRLKLEAAGLLKENPWEDQFQILQYTIWQDYGRLARQGSMMGSPDVAVGEGFFMLQQKLTLATAIYETRMETGEIETALSWNLFP